MVYYIISKIVLILWIAMLFRDSVRLSRFKKTVKLQYFIVNEKIKDLEEKIEKIEKISIDRDK